MDMQVMLMVVARTTIVYAFLFGVVRLLGKRKLGVHTAMDLLVTILLADLASQAVFGTVSLWYGLLAVAVVGAWHFAGYQLSAHYPSWRRWLTDPPMVVIRDGEAVKEALAAERLSQDELASLLRQQGIDDLAEVKLAYLEPTGRLGVVRQEWARTAQRGDLRATERGA